MRIDIEKTKIVLEIVFSIAATNHGRTPHQNGVGPGRGLHLAHLERI